MLKKLEKEEEEKALDIISQCKTQEEAVKRIRKHFGEDATLNMRCWRALTELKKKAGK